MDMIDHEIEFLRSQIDELNVQLSLLSVKQRTAAEVALKFAQKLEIFRAKRRDALQTLHDLEAHRDGSYMWENIGDGG